MKSPDFFRYGFTALVMLAAFALIAVPAAAHSPSDIQLSYNDAAKELTVVITHPVPDPQSHYIRNVKVKVNDVVSVDKDYTSQPSGDSVTYIYSLPLNKGDTIRVTATCNQGPSLTKVMDIPAPAATTASAAAPAQSLTPQPASNPAASAPVPTQKSPLGLLPVIGAVAFLLVKKR